MEAIIIIIGELLAFSAAPLFVLLGEGFLLIINFFIEIICLFFPSFKNSKTSESKETPVKTKISPQIKRKIQKILSRTFIVTFSVTILGLILIQTVFFKDTFHWLTSKVQDKTGISIQAEMVQGNIFFGEIKLDNIKVIRENHEISNFNIQIKELSSKISLFSLLSNEVKIDYLKVIGVSGQFERLKKKDKIKKKKPFIIDDLKLADIDLKFIDKTLNQTIAFPLTIEKLETSPLKSNYMVFHILFRSNINGSIDGHPFKVFTEEYKDGRRTISDAKKFPIHKVARYAGAPLNWIKNGHIDIHVEDRWAFENDTEIDSQWKLNLYGMRSEVPKELSFLKKSVAVPIVTYLNFRKKNLDLEFGFKLEKGEFEYSANPDTKILIEKFKTALLNALKEKVGTGKLKVLENKSNKLESESSFKLKDLFKKKKKGSLK